MTTYLKGVLAVLVTGSAILMAQGRSSYCNFESPQVKPITIGRIGTGTLARDYLFVCNTPDNSIEVYDLTANRNAPPFVASIPVGLEPVSVVFQRFPGTPTRHMLYSVNWLADSVTFVELNQTGTPSNFGLVYTVTNEVAVTAPTEKHVVVGSGPTVQSFLRSDDEPMHLAVLNGPAPLPAQTLVISKRTASSYTLIDAFSGAILDAVDSGGTNVVGGGANVIMATPDFPVPPPPQPRPLIQHSIIGQSPLGLPLPTGATMAPKEPHTVLRRPGASEFWVLAHQGGGSDLDHDSNPPQPGAVPRYDFDVWGIRFNPAGTPPEFSAIRGLGVTNFNMAFSGDGNRLYVVGTDPSDATIGNSNLLDGSLHPSGFVRTMLYQIDLLNEVVTPFDLNLRSGAPAAKTASLAHATDLVVYRPQGTTGEYVCVTGFNSDTFGLVQIGAGTASIVTCSVENTGTGVAGALVGPRGLALLADPANASLDRVYVHNRFDNSFTIINPRAAAMSPLFVAKRAMRRSNATDPVPASVRAGQQFLYSTEFSVNGFVACASCHVDGRSDQQQWRLSAHDAAIPLAQPLSLGIGNAAALEEELDAASSPDIAGLVQNGFPVDGAFPPPGANAKGPMITQSLQGLVNFEVGGNLFDVFHGNRHDDLVSNAPYHWRGDKENFKHFNEAFVNLQGAPPSSTPPSVPGALSDTQLLAYEQFVNSIHYPPNPLQPITRTYSGDTWTDPSSFVGATAGTGGKQGLKLFHILPIAAFGLRSCVQCHFLPEGSNNRLTCQTVAQDANIPRPGPQAIESAALRGLFQKEARFELDAVVPTTLIPGPRLRTGDLGLLHEGLVQSGTPAAPAIAPLSRNEFMNLVPLPQLGSIDSARARTAIDTFLREFDHGIAPIVGMSRAVTMSNKASPEITSAIDAMEGQANAANCGVAVYARMQTSSAFVERGYWLRISAAGPSYKEVGGGTETRATLLNLIDAAGELLIFRATPLGSEERIASFKSADPPTSLVPQAVSIAGTTPNTANKIVVGIGALPLADNWVLGTSAGQFNWSGVAPEPLSLQTVKRFQEALQAQGVALRHDVPRRLQIVGTNLVNGAMIRLSWPADPSKFLELPIFPTKQIVAAGQVWETAVEFEPLQLYVMMCGGPADPDVQCVLSGASSCNPLTAKNVTLSARNTPQAAWTPGMPVPLLYPSL